MKWTPVNVTMIKELQCNYYSPIYMRQSLPIIIYIIIYCHKESELRVLKSKGPGEAGCFVWLFVCVFSELRFMGGYGLWIMGG